MATSRNIPQIINAHNGDSKTKAKHHDHKKVGTFNPPIVSKGKKSAACWLCFSLLISACFKSIRYIRTFEKVLQLSWIIDEITVFVFLCRTEIKKFLRRVVLNRYSRLEVSVNHLHQRAFLKMKQRMVPVGNSNPWKINNILMIEKMIIIITVTVMMRSEIICANILWIYKDSKICFSALTSGTTLQY